LDETKGTDYFSSPASSAASEYLFLPDTAAVFFFTLRTEHGHAVGEFAAGGELLSPQRICDVPVVNADY
jgi:hypothetical protein